MRTWLLVGISSLLLGSPAMSATYYVDGQSTGLPEDDTVSGDTPDSVSGGDEGATFTANATNVGGGSVSVFASEGLSDVTDYNTSAGSHYYGLDGGAAATVNYTIRVSGPVTCPTLSAPSTPPSSPARTHTSPCNTPKGTCLSGRLSFLLHLCGYAP
jgi:hypothetical protein